MLAPQPWLPMLLLLLLLLPPLLLASTVAPTSSTSYRGRALYRVTFTDQQLPLLDHLRKSTSIRVWNAPGQPTYVVMVPPQLHRYFREKLRRQGVAHQLLVPDVEQIFQRKHNIQWKPMAQNDGGTSISFSRYHRYDEGSAIGRDHRIQFIRQYLLNLAASFPIRVRVETIGQSYEGRSLDVIQISSGGDGARPVILMDAGIHAREWIAPAAALYVINQLVENGVHSSLVNSIDWHILPLINPDGYEYTFTTDRMWRKTRSFGPFLCRGVDANRNFDFHWNEVGTSESSCGEAYAGEGPFSEPETRALRDYVLKNADRIKLYLTLHSYGGYILYPWGYTTELPEDWETLHALAKEANAAQIAAGGQNFTIGSSRNAMYPVSGNSDDWVKAVAGVPLSYTIELPAGGSQGFDLPESDIISIVKPFFESVRVFGQYIAANYE
ncbi:carboxypeptidase B-like [Schistocerca americana]|uniref:carboxypeptidase B-like n=1 Tax=Schistocerca americana TaxID=7009 RepID=UPI001F4F7DD9|nr:carboxypeptidase B-like [Schistocerca americana]